MVGRNARLSRLGVVVLSAVVPAAALLFYWPTSPAWAEPAPPLEVGSPFSSGLALWDSPAPAPQPAAPAAPAPAVEPAAEVVELLSDWEDTGVFKPKKRPKRNKRQTSWPLSITKFR